MSGCKMTSLRIPQIMASLLVLAGANFAPAQSTNTDRLLPSQQQLSRFGLERAWWGQATLNLSRDKVRHVSMDEDMVFVISTGGIATAFDSETGKIRWSMSLGRFDQPSYPLVSNENLALAVVGSTLYAIEKKTGRITWTLVLPAQPSTAPGVDEDQVYIGTLDGSVYAYSLRTVRRLYQEQRLPQWSAEAMVWRSQAGKEITSPPIPSGRTVSYASRDKSLYAVSTADKQLIYQLETNAPIIAPLATNGKMLFLASEDYTLFALNSQNGRIVWDFTAGLPIRRAPFVISNDLYLAPDRGGLYCMNAVEGTKRWWQPHLSSFVAVVGNTVYTSDIDGNLVRVSRADGGISGSLPMRAFSVRVSNDRTDRIYMSTESGLLIALRMRGETIPVFHKYPDRLPIVPEVEPEEPTPPVSGADAATSN